MKNRNLVILLGIIILFAGYVLLNVFRYKVTGTNEGYIYKTDRLTGKTWIVTPLGEKEIGGFQVPTSTPAPDALLFLDLKMLDIQTVNQGANILVKNEGSKTIEKIVFKVIRYTKEGGSVVDTEYLEGNKSIAPGDTVTEFVSLTANPNSTFYTAQVYEAF